MLRALAHALRRLKRTIHVTLERRARARSNTVTVTRIVDGDTIRARDAFGRDITVRLLNVDAPELNEPLGPAARTFLEGLLLRSRAVRLVRDAGCDVDRYGRLLRLVLIPNPRGRYVQHGVRHDNASELIARAGLGRALAIGRNRSFVTCVKKAEAHARRHRMGIWR
jgi:micrococcal nuclease